MADNDRGKADGFLTRWSERKRAVREHEAAAEEEAAQQPAETRDDAAEAEMLAANRAAAEAIDLDSLTAQSDITPFLKPGVPAALKSAALGKLWRSDPVFACLDGLDIYREDYNNPAYLLKGGTSSWLPGSGYAKRLMELEEKAKGALTPAEDRFVERAPGSEEGPAAEAASAPREEDKPSETAGPTQSAESAAEDEPGGEPSAEEAEEGPRVPLRSRLDFAAFKGGS